ncbi:MAG: RES family NAD+ phosphorylase [Flavobacteriales bacterium]|nr:RES family NAD+ phosphorylase [Flavobacteriales bacterium]
MAFSGRVFRIANSRHADDLSGEGAYLFGGRWNSEGVRMLYTSESSSLSILEVLAYVSNKTFAIKEIVTIEVPNNSIREIPLGSLAKEWDNIPASNYTKSIGDAWSKSLESLILIVPSVINPSEQNILINPLHPSFSEVRIVSKEVFSFDRRLLNK